MNPEAPDFELQLRLATSRQPLTSSDDPETASLRSGFLALGKALEEAADGADSERRLLAALSETQPLVVLPISKIAQAEGDARRTTYWMVATVAALLLTVGAVAYATRSKSNLPDLAQPDKTPATNPAVIPPSDSPQIVIEDVSPTPTTSSETLDWDDSLDESFNTAERLVQRAGTLSTAADAEFVTLHRQIQAAADDMQDESL